MAIENRPLEVIWGAHSGDTDPGMADTVAQVQQGLVSSASANDRYAADAHRFIVENGAAVLGGHAPVNDPE